MAESEQMAAIREIADSFNRGDFDALVAYTDSETVLHEWPSAPGAQSYQGPDGIRRAFESWFESWEWMRIDVEDMEEAGTRVMATFQQTARGKGSAAEVELRTFNVWTFREGTVTAIHLFTDRESALAVLAS
jgi:ketosteroid isomerase-like protein